MPHSDISCGTWGIQCEVRTLALGCGTKQLEQPRRVQIIECWDLFQENSVCCGLLLQLWLGVRRMTESVPNTGSGVLCRMFSTQWVLAGVEPSCCFH